MTDAPNGQLDQGFPAAPQMDTPKPPPGETTPGRKISTVLWTNHPPSSPLWLAALQPLGISCTSRNPWNANTAATDDGTGDGTPSVAAPTREDLDVVIVDGQTSTLDEDELLTTVAHLRAKGTRVAVHLPAGCPSEGARDVLDEMCPGWVTNNDTDIHRVAQLIARRLDPKRTQRLEFVTLAPDGSGQLLIVTADGQCVLRQRPVHTADDGSAIVDIQLSEDATQAWVHLASHQTVTLTTADIPIQQGAPETTLGQIPITGKKLGARVKELRLAAGLTQAELARRTGIHRPNIARVEAGRHTPSLETLDRLAQAIGVPTTQLLYQH